METFKKPFIGTIDMMVHPVLARTPRPFFTDSLRQARRQKHGQEKVSQKINSDDDKQWETGE